MSDQAVDLASSRPPPLPSAGLIISTKKINVFVSGGRQSRESTTLTSPTVLEYGFWIWRTIHLIRGAYIAVGLQSWRSAHLGASNVQDYGIRILQEPTELSHGLYILED